MAMLVASLGIGDGDDGSDSGSVDDDGGNGGSADGGGVCVFVVLRELWKC